MKQPYFSFSPALLEAVKEVEAVCGEAFTRIENTEQLTSARVLAAFMRNRVSEAHLQGSTGYGYGDRGRDTLDRVFADALGCEDALVRHHFVSGTAAIATALFGVLRPGDRMICLTGTPYDTLHGVLGIGKTQDNGSLRDFGIRYEELALQGDGTVDTDALPAAVKGARVAYIQRSRGYSLRPSLSVKTIGALVRRIRSAEPQALILVDNCYGEFVEAAEPCEVGADLIMGSLIKNPGGGIARTGGYIAGRRDLVELCAHRLTAPGMGREVGCSLDENKNMYLGLFFAPGVVASALKTAVFCAALMEKLGYDVYPKANAPRCDIIQTVVLGSAEKLSAFCRGIQKGAPVDSFVVPEAWDMPGYDSKVIMAAGAFHLGASIELSADGPMRPPYAAWMQGGLTFPTGKLGVMLAAQSMLELSGQAHEQKRC